MGIYAARGLALLRIGFGLYFLLAAWKKTAGANWFKDAGPLMDFMQKNLPQAEAFYRPFIERTVLPQVDVFADLVTLGEWTAGILLTLGLLTRLGGLLAMFLVLNYMLAKGV